MRYSLSETIRRSDCNSVTSDFESVAAGFELVGEVSGVKVSHLNLRMTGVENPSRPAPGGLRSIFMLPRVRNARGGVDTGKVLGFD